MVRIFTALTLTALFAIMLTISTPAQARATTVTSTDYSDMSVAELIELINKLKAQLEELRGKTSAKCFVSEKSLVIGDGEYGDGHNADVERLQAFLREKGHFTFYKNTGFFGNITRAALLSFQAVEGLSQTGNFDATTRAKIHGMNCNKAHKKTTKYESHKKEVKKEASEKKTKTESASTVSSITVSADGEDVTWSTVGNSPKGFKVVWSKNDGPTYPTRSGDKYNYHSESSTNSSDIYAFDGAGTYYVRVCEYLGGKCGVYSNEVTVELE